MYISKGNMKLNASIFNLPAVITCKEGLKCHSYCYARKAERYPHVIRCRQENYNCSMKDNFIEQVVKILEKRTNKVCRIHESGDFYSLAYIVKWFKIASQMLDWQFYCYTKRDDLFTETLMRKKPRNMRIMFSIDGIDAPIQDKGIFDGVACVSSKESTCPAQTKKDIKCMSDCKKCLSCPLITFKKH